MDKLIRFFKDEDGVTAIEYGIIAALIIVISIAMITSSGTGLLAAWTSISGALN